MNLLEQIAPLYAEASRIALNEVLKIMDWCEDKHYPFNEDSEWHGVERSLGGSVEYISIENGVLIAHVDESGWEWGGTRAIPVDPTFADRTIARLQARIDKADARAATEQVKQKAAKEAQDAAEYERLKAKFEAQSAPEGGDK